MMSAWTFACDESGSFRDDERCAFIVGGVLLPAPAEATHDLKGLLEAVCKRQNIQYPPHAWVLRAQNDSNSIGQLFSATTGWLERHAGYFIGLVTKPRSQPLDEAIHARMLGGLVELAARIAAANGADSLDLRPASRTPPLRDEKRARAAANLGMRLGRDDRGVVVEGVLGSEIRESLESLSRSPSGTLPAWPALRSVRVESAQRADTHAGVTAADLFCNAIYAGLSKKAALTTAELTTAYPGWSEQRVLLVDYHLLRSLCSADDGLRRSPTGLYDFSVARHEIEVARATSTSDRFAIGVEGAARTAELLWEKAEPRLAALCDENPQFCWAIAQRLAGDVRSELDLKHGAYEAVAGALALGFTREAGELAHRLRSVHDRELQAHLWRLTLETANHRGDVDGAQRAHAAFKHQLSAGRSLFLLAEQLKVENLANVAAQNQFPASAERVSGLSTELRERARELAALAREIHASALLAPASAGHVTISTDEQELYRASGVAGLGPRAADREHGRCLGTAARSLAFLGELEEARTLALEARCYFGDSPFDRAFNASVLARIELERARISQPDRQLLARLLRLSGCESLSSPQAIVARIRSASGARFTLDLLLCAELWLEANETSTQRALIDDLGRGTSSLVFGCLAGLRSHPTELVARHAAELLRQHRPMSKARDAWFALSLSLTDAAAEGTTLRRFSAFTRQLAEGRAPEGPPGSLLNPSFEYR